jgi:beta-aspartyl-peptidase (threonine type)
LKPVLKRKSLSYRCVLAIHGGAGTIDRNEMNSRRERRYHEALAAALRAGYAILKDDGTSMDAVVAAVVVLEDSPLFNAGRGAVFNASGEHELDAAVMEGATSRAGGVACVRRVKNPVLAARAVMERSPHVLLAGAAADRFARDAGVPIVAPQYFSTPQRTRALVRARSRTRPRPQTVQRRRASRHRRRRRARPLRKSCRRDLDRRVHQQDGGKGG